MNIPCNVGIFVQIPFLIVKPWVNGTSALTIWCLVYRHREALFFGVKIRSFLSPLIALCSSCFLFHSFFELNVVDWNMISLNGNFLVIVISWLSSFCYILCFWVWVIWFVYNRSSRFLIGIATFEFILISWCRPGINLHQNVKRLSLVVILKYIIWDDITVEVWKWLWCFFRIYLRW